MYRALTNLLTNAIQAVSVNGSVVVRGRNHPEKPEQVLIEVLDNGPGLSAQVQDKVFKPFFTTKRSGTGLGLANVKKIVELHSGAVSAYNRPEGGAAFAIQLPKG
jgi:signal transduction histidine kinase